MLSTAILSLVVLAQRSPEPRLEIVGAVRTRLAFTNAELRTRFGAEAKEVSFTLKGEAGHARAIPLAMLVQAAGLKVDPRRKHGDLAFAVVAEGEDGYAATFGMGDLDEELGHPVWAALDWNDKPLAPDAGPIRLIVPGDAKPARWVQAVRRLRLVDLAPRKLKPSPTEHGM